MSSYQQQRASSSNTRGRRPRRGGNSDDMQNLVGNTGTRDSLHAQGNGTGEEMQGDVWGMNWLHDQTGWDWTQDLNGWWDGLWSQKDDVGPTIDTPGPIVTRPESQHDEVLPHPIIEEPEEVVGPQIDRTDAVTKGMKGAVISGGVDIDLRDGPGADASVTGCLTEGKPVEVVKVQGQYIKVEYRVSGNKEEQGWVSSAFFSDQPALNRDEDHPEMMDDHIWQLYEKDKILPEAGQLKGTEVKQGGLADCYFVAAMIAVGSARPAFLEESFRYNESTGLYQVRFFEETGYDYRTRETQYEEVWVEVDGYLPTSKDGKKTAYARANPELWGVLMEKAYAKWQGGYEEMGNGGYGSEAMASLSGMQSESATPSRMSAEEVLEFFNKAQSEGQAIYAGTQSSWESEKQTPLSRSASSETDLYKGKVTQIHDWNKINPGSLTITDKGDGAAGSAHDTGTEYSKKSDIQGLSVAEGEVDYAHPGKISVTYKEDMTPKEASDLEVAFDFKGMIAPQYQLVGWHGYAFKEVVDGKLQFHNPWGSWQPKPITPEDFTKYFSSCSTNLVPQAKAAQDADE
jgi:hypothetical protein